MVSAEPAVRMQRLARLAGGRPRADRAADSRRRSKRSGPRWPATGVRRASTDAYLAKFGDRTVNELKLESATLHDDPLPLFRAVGALARQCAAAGGDHACHEAAGSAGRSAPAANRGGASRDALACASRCGGSSSAGCCGTRSAGCAIARTCGSSGRACSAASAASSSRLAAGSTRSICSTTRVTSSISRWTRCWRSPTAARRRPTCAPSPRCASASSPGYARQAAPGRSVRDAWAGLPRPRLPPRRRIPGAGTQATSGKASAARPASFADRCAS